MSKFIGKDRIDASGEMIEGNKSVLEQAFTKDIDMPPSPLMLHTTQVDIDPSRLEIDISGADHPGLWFSVILSSMLSSFLVGSRITAKRCLAPDCRKFFLPNPRSHGQLYHSSTCRSRHNMQKRRSKLLS
ncbi:CGNR zinc finger domain-containing protein [Candidatus Poribacteria bacterium]